jgi:hypothetical protein
MKKIIFFSVVLFLLVAPAWAAQVVIRCAQVGETNEVTISYDINTVPGKIRAFGLNVTTDKGVINDADKFNTHYWVYPGQIDINATTGVVDDNGVPICDPCDLPGGTTLPGLGTNGVSIEMGSLYVGGPNAPPNSGTLLSIYINSPGDCNVIPAGNVARAGTPGVVMEDPDQVVSVLFKPVKWKKAVAMCTVPNVVGMKAADANAAIIAAGFVVGTKTTAYSETVEYLKIISQNPVPGVQPCGSAVGYQVSDGSDCYVGRPDYTTQWTPAGRPRCWCYPRQCHGDADGIKHGTGGMGGYWYVGQPDLDIMGAGWLVKEPTKGTGILNLKVNGVPVACADFGHDLHGTGGMGGYWRIGQPDLDKMGLYWLVKEPTKGTGTPADCLPGNRNP